MDGDSDFHKNLLDNLESEIRDDWPYKILSKDSASPSLLVLTGDGRRDMCPRIVEEGKYFSEGLAVKTWCRTDGDDFNKRHRTDEEKALEYEKKIYTRKIKPIMDLNEEDIDNPSEYVPILRYIGDDDDCSTVETLIRFIGIDLESDSPEVLAQRDLLYLAFYVTDAIVRDPGFEAYIKPINFMMVEFYRKFFGYLTEAGKERFRVKFPNIRYWKIGALLLPRTKFRTFDEYFGYSSQSSLFQQVVKGLYMVNKAGVVHNDLHCGNIMIKKNVDGVEPVRKVMIYDWDRGYSPDLGPNELLDTSTDTGLCAMSQCNLFMEQRPIDLLKILRYVADSRDDFFDILQNGLKLQNNFVEGLPRYDAIHSALKRCSRDDYFYTFEGYSSLYKIGQCPRLEHAIALMGGTWDVIFHNIFPDLEIRAPEAGAVMAMSERSVNTIPEYLVPLANIFADIVNREFRIGIEKDKRGIEVIEDLVSTVELYTKCTRTGTGKKRVRFRVSRDSPSEKYVFDLKILKRLRGKLSTELSWSEFNSLRNVVDYLKFGPGEIFTGEFREEPIDFDEGRDFAEILVENENRKAELLKQIITNPERSDSFSSSEISTGYSYTDDEIGRDKEYRGTGYSYTGYSDEIGRRYSYTGYSDEIGGRYYLDEATL
jgi:hypothetical protein